MMNKTAQRRELFIVLQKYTEYKTRWAFSAGAAM
jgi:hypothetical protein